MTKRLPFFAVFLAALLPLAAFAEEGPELLEAHTHMNDQASLQRGATLFMNYCSGCHSLQYQRYSRIGEDLGLTEDQVTKSFVFTGVKVGEHINVAMNPTDAAAWFGKTPPDLSLEGRSRGPDWIYTYLHSFYVDESRPLGWNNTLLPNASMPNVLWQLQGLQRPVMGKDAGCQPSVDKLLLADKDKGTLDPEQYDQAARDISAFLQYVAEPAAIQRETYGVWVVLFLAFFSFLAYLLKHEYWRDVH
jgi:ubiquinol-cytochrome c reductase cytochrome c1 subunit